MHKIKNVVLAGVTGVFLISLFATGLNSCMHESEIIDDIPEICFEAEILPIFKNSCALSGCHDEIAAEEDYIFSNYENIVKAVVPGEANNSEAYLSMIDFRSDDLMPPNQPLSLENRSLIRIWIDQGAKNTTCPDTSTHPIDTTLNPQDTATWVNPRACFDRDILPILQASCAFSGCHDAVTAAGERVYIDYAGTLKGVRPGDPEESNLYQKLVESNADDIMPPSPYDPLPQAQIDSIYNWILYGALDEYCGVACDTTAVTYSGIIWPIIELSCASCHRGGSPSGGVSLTNYSEVAATASNGILLKVLSGNGASLMPPGGALSDCKISQVEKWITNGFPND